MPRRPEFYPLCPRRMPTRNWLKPDSLSMAYSRLQAGFMSDRFGSVYPWRLCMVILPPGWPQILCIKQPPWAPSYTNNTLDWHHCRITQRRQHCTLSMTNSTTSEGCLQKSNFIEEGDPIQAIIHLKVVCLYAIHYLSNRIRECSQWLLEANNNFSNTLSQDNDRTNDKLTRILPFTALLSFCSTSKQFRCQTR